MITVKYLLEHNAYVNPVDRYKMSPLHYACEAGDIEIVKLLVVYGAHLHSEDESGKTPIEVAGEMENYEIVQYLKTAKSITNCELECGREYERCAVYLHVMNDCPKRITPCPRLCNISTLKAEDIETHMNEECPERYKICPLGCGINLRLADMGLHTSMNCPSIRTATCYVGCTVLASALQQHEQDHHIKPIIEWSVDEFALWLKINFIDIFTDTLPSYELNVKRLCITGRSVVLLKKDQLRHLLQFAGFSSNHRQILIEKISKRRIDDGSEDSLNGVLYMPIARGTATMFKLVGDIKVEKKTTVLRRIRPILEDTMAGRDVFPEGFEIITLPDGEPVSREKEGYLPVLRCGGFIVLRSATINNNISICNDNNSRWYTGLIHDTL